MKMTKRSDLYEVPKFRVKCVHPLSKGYGDDDDDDEDDVGDDVGNGGKRRLGYNTESINFTRSNSNELQRCHVKCPEIHANEMHELYDGHYKVSPNLNSLKHK